MRKLISLNGFEGLVDQLQDGEVLVVAYQEARQMQYIYLPDVQTFDQYVYYMIDPLDLRGFFACPPHVLTKVNCPNYNQEIMHV